MTLSRNVKTMDISNTLFAEVMRMGLDLPEDFRVREAKYDPLRDCLNFVIESEDFEEIPEASIPPPIIIVPTKVSCPECGELDHYRIIYTDDEKTDVKYYDCMICHTHWDKDGVNLGKF